MCLYSFCEKNYIIHNIMTQKFDMNENVFMTVLFQLDGYMGHCLRSFVAMRSLHGVIECGGLLLGY